MKKLSFKCYERNRLQGVNSTRTPLIRGAEAGGDGGIYPPPIFQIFANFRSKIPSEGLKNP